MEDATAPVIPAAPNTRAVLMLAKPDKPGGRPTDIEGANVRLPVIAWRITAYRAEPVLEFNSYLDTTDRNGCYVGELFILLPDQPAGIGLLRAITSGDRDRKLYRYDEAVLHVLQTVARAMGFLSREEVAEANKASCHIINEQRGTE